MVSLNQPFNLHSYSASKILGVATLTFEVTWRAVICHVTIGLAIYGSPYRCSIWIHRLLRTVFKILSLKDTGVTTLTLRVTWRHLSHDHWIRNMGFPIGGQYKSTMYLARLLRYWASKILGLRPWTFMVTWRHHVASLLRYYVSNTYPSKFPLKMHWSHFSVLGAKLGL